MNNNARVCEMNCLFNISKYLLQVQRRLSYDGAESVEAKQEASEQENEVDSGINSDAESVTARGQASEDDSDMEEGEIQGEYFASLMWCVSIAFHACNVPCNWQLLTYFR